VRSSYGLPVDSTTGSNAFALLTPTGIHRLQFRSHRPFNSAITGKGIPSGTLSTAVENTHTGRYVSDRNGGYHGRPGHCLLVHQYGSNISRTGELLRVRQRTS
jgi:hypothetical protein